MTISDLLWTPDTARLDAIVLWERNPKTMSKARAERLLRSWQEMGQYQTLAVGPDGSCYDGTQCVLALRAAGYKGDYEVAVRRSNRALTEAERERLVIESTVGTVGMLDWDMLAGWDDLEQWGLDAEALAAWNNDAANLREMMQSTGEPLDYDEIYKGMPEFEQEENFGAVHSLKVHFATAEDIQVFSEIVGQTVNETTVYIWFPKQEKENLKAYRVIDES